MRDDDRRCPSCQGAMKHFHGIDEDGLLGTETEELKGAYGLGMIETHEPEMLAIAVEFGLTEEGGLEEMEDVGGGLYVEVLIVGEADLHMNKVFIVNRVFSCLKKVLTKLKKL